MQQVAVIRQIVILGMLVLIGFFSGRTRYLPENSGIILSRIVIKITMPALIITTLTGYDFTKQEIKDGFIVYFCGIIFLVFSFFISKLISDRLDIDEDKKNIYKMNSVFGNVVFMAFPLLDSLYGSRGIIYGTFFQMANDTILWTLGIYLVNRHNTKNWRSNLKHFFNINTIVFITGILAVSLNLHKLINSSEVLKKAYKIFFDTLNPLGKSTTYLSMIFIGLILSETKMSCISDVFKRYSIFILSFVKLLVIPLAAYLILFFAGRNLDPLVVKVIVLQLAMPCGAIVSALAAQYNSDYRYATECVFFSTVLSAFSIPLIVFILG